MNFKLDHFFDKETIDSLFYKDMKIILSLIDEENEEVEDKKEKEFKNLLASMHKHRQKEVCEY